MANKNTCKKLLETNKDTQKNCVEMEKVMSFTCI